MSAPSNASSAWPPALKEWVQKCLSQATTMNKPAVHAEVKALIAEAYSANTMWEKDWSNVQLQALQPRPPPVIASKKRKVAEVVETEAAASSPKATKTAKKISIQMPTNMSESQRQLREKRFEREHEIERLRQSGQGPEYTYSRHVNAPPEGGSLLDRMEVLSASRPLKKRVYSENVANAFDPNVLNWDRQTIVGRCMDLEKPYFRLTSEPDPANVRPLPVLEKTLQMLTLKYKEGTSYSYICDQFKSLRQDLTVQRITNAFTVKVYEIHARIALECKDLVEYNQCQSTLKTLHGMGLDGHYEEFIAYRILYFLYTRARSELNFLLGQLTPEQKASPAIRNALDVQKALATNNYHAFFVLYLTAPNMGPYMMDFYADRERVTALVIMCKAYHKLPVSFLASELGFSSASDAVEFLQKNQAAWFEGMSNPNTQPQGPWKPVQREIPDSDKVLDCKKALPNLLTAAAKYKKLDIPRI